MSWRDGRGPAARGPVRLVGRLALSGWLALALVSALSLLPFFSLTSVAASAIRPSAASPQFTATPIDAIAADPALSAEAAAVAAPVYADHCASCHGAQREGSQARGVPNLRGPNRLWGDATADSELQALAQTISFGIRSGHPQARNVSEMPAFAHDPAVRLNPQQIGDVVEYVLFLSGRGTDKPAARRGRELYAGSANCFDCHSADGSGNRDWGVPDLTQRDSQAWIYGNGSEAIRQSVSEGRKGSCPAWVTQLDASDIKALAVWIGAGKENH